MRKSAKVGLAAFIIIMSVLIAVVGSACIIIFVRPDFPMPRYTKENMDSLIEKLPAVDDDSFTADDNNTVMRELVLNQGELNALLALRGKGNVGFSWENISVIFEVEGASAEIREEQLTLTVKMDDICSPTGYEAFDNVLKGAVARVRMEADNNVRVTGLKLNNIDSSVVPEAFFEGLPGYNGGGAAGYATEIVQGRMEEIFAYLAFAKKIDSIAVRDNLLYLRGEFYGMAPQAE